MVKVAFDHPGFIRGVLAMVQFRLAFFSVGILILSGCTGTVPSDQDFDDDAEPSDDSGIGQEPQASAPPNSKGNQPAATGGSSGGSPKKPPKDEGPKYSNVTVNWTDGKMGTKVGLCSDSGCTLVPLSQDKTMYDVELDGLLERGFLELSWDATSPTTKDLSFSIRGCQDAQCTTPSHVKAIKGGSPLPLQLDFSDWKDGENARLQVTTAGGSAGTRARANIPLGSVVFVYEQPFTVQGTLIIQDTS